MLTRIAHTTDFSASSEIAFQHALRLAIASKAQLDILHVDDRGSGHHWSQFPHVRETLARWGLLRADAHLAEVETVTGVHVSKIEIHHHDPLDGITAFLHAHRPDLVVVATHGRQGLSRVLNGSVSEDVVTRTHVPTLLIGEHAQGFVDSSDGKMHLGRILLPVADHPPAGRSLLLLERLLDDIGVASDRIDIVTVDCAIEALIDDRGHSQDVERLSGPVVDTILAAAMTRKANLIVMPTTGQHGILDAIRGRTTSRVFARASCPVLALPIEATGL